MEKFIFYNTTTGDINFVKRFNAADAHQNCRMTPGMHCIAESAIGVVLNKDRQKIDLDTMTLVSKSIPVKPFELELREKRNNVLKMCDWTQAADSPLSDAKKAEWATYRQALRDMPTNCGSASCVRDVVWPTPPA
jgi:hypothetical protein